MNQIHSSDYPVTCLNWFNDYIYISTTKDVQYYNMAERNPGRRHIDEKECDKRHLESCDNPRYIAAFYSAKKKKYHMSGLRTRLCRGNRQWRTGYSNGRISQIL